MLLGGDYVRALVAFDEVLAKGFSGQTFMAGLNRHMRDLLMAKRPETLRLIEMTGTLLERYRMQAGACEVGFLFGAIACLTELDGRIRQSSNQRLLVELGLMKIAGLGQKKNDSLTSPEDYPLPELSKAPQPAAAPVAAVSAAATPVTASAQSATPAPEPVSTGSVAVEPVPSAPAAAPAPQATPVVAPSVASEPQPTPAAAASQPETPSLQPAQPAATSAQQPVAGPSNDAPGPAPASSASVPHAAVSSTATAASAAAPTASAAPAAPATSRPARKSLISGASLADLIAGAEASDPASEGDSAPQVPSDFDPACTEKLERSRGRILEMIRSRRPRFVPAFEEMKIQKNIISVSVPTMELHDEIMRNKTAMLIRIAEMAGVMGVIDLRVTVNEAIRAARPIRPEDKLKFLTEKNPLVAELRKVLDLEME